MFVLFKFVLFYFPIYHSGQETEIHWIKIFFVLHNEENIWIQDFNEFFLNKFEFTPTSV